MKLGWGTIVPALVADRPMSIPSLPIPYRIMALMPHPDDFEFNVGGAFALLRQRLKQDVVLHVTTSTTGASGHHLMNAEETAECRKGEAEAAVKLIGASFSFLRNREGQPFHRQFLIQEDSLAAVWREIRAFRPHLLFAPPPVTDPLSGIHIDHESTAQAVRQVAYQLSVPRAYEAHPTPQPHYQAPLILLADDTYASESVYDFRLEIGSVYPRKLQMAKQHRSQIYEWLPYVSETPPPTEAEYEERFLLRHQRVNLRYGFPDAPPSEYYRISRWGRAPVPGELSALFGEHLSAREEDCI